MVETAVAVEPNRLMMIDRLVQALEEVYQIVDDNIGDVPPKVFAVIEPILDEVKNTYGRNSTDRLKVISEERKKHAKELNGKDTD